MEGLKRIAVYGGAPLPIIFLGAAYLLWCISVRRQSMSME